jgi:RNA polymerase sigma-70 factor, ECF subfamily
MEIHDNPKKLPLSISELEAFIDKHKDRLVNHAFYRLGNLQDAEDVVQDVFVKLFTIETSKANIGSLIGYAWRMVVNACTDEIRRGKGNKISLDEANAVDLSLQDNKESEMIIREDFIRINKLLGVLPVEQSEVLRFRFSDGLTFNEIAVVLELPVSTVKSRFKYGLNKMKTQFLNQKEVTHEL